MLGPQRRSSDRSAVATHADLILIALIDDAGLIEPARRDVVLSQDDIIGAGSGHAGILIRADLQQEAPVLRAFQLLFCSACAERHSIFVRANRYQEYGCARLGREMRDDIFVEPRIARGTEEFLTYGGQRSRHAISRDAGHKAAIGGIEPPLSDRTRICRDHGRSQGAYR
jgi:hypothetical protein